MGIGRNLAAAVIIFSASASDAIAQSAPTLAQGSAVDPRQPLNILIKAFQDCGPPHAYSLLGAQLYSMIFSRTNGSGCFEKVRELGPTSGMQITGSDQFPQGPVFSIRVRHQNGRAGNWFIGINQQSGRVEYLSFQLVAESEPLPKVEVGPRPNAFTAGSSPSHRPSMDGCRLYPSMCAR